MTKPVVYGFGHSTYVRTVRMALIEKGVDYDLVPISIFSGETKQDAYLERHPFGRVPAFEHEGFRLYETDPIVTYVDRAFGGPTLIPADAKTAARTTQFMAITHAYLYPKSVFGIIFPLVVGPREGKPADPDTAEKAMPDVRRVFEAMEDLAEREGRLVGDGRTAADLYLVPLFAYLGLAGVLGDLLAPLPKLKHWWLEAEDWPSTHQTVPQ